jgi:hypothetical protein
MTVAVCIHRRALGELAGDPVSEGMPPGRKNATLLLQQRSPRHSASLCTMQCTMQNPPVIPKDEFRRMRWHAWSCIQALYVQLTGIGCAHMLHLPFEELSVVFVETNDDSASIISASLWRACRI